MLKARDLMTGVKDYNMQVLKVLISRNFDQESKQVVIKSNDTTLKKKYGGPQLYTVKIEARNGVPKITPNTEVKVYCNCHDFIFRRAWCLNQQGSLLIPEGFIDIPPEKTNSDCKKMHCKHVSQALTYLIQTGK